MLFLRYNLFYILRENSVFFSIMVQKDHRSVSSLMIFLMKSFCTKCYIIVLEASLMSVLYIDIKLAKTAKTCTASQISFPKTLFFFSNFMVCRTRKALIFPA